MSRSDGTRDRIRQLQQDEAGADEPALERRMKVVGNGRGNNTPYVSPTEHGAEVAGIEIGDSVTVEAYRDRIVIRSNE
jgi:hypothetical protein